jgi:hypothetical protein
MERKTATRWGSHRVPLSGINSRHNAGDVILKDLNLLIECKFRAKNVQHTLFRAAQADAAKNGVNPLHVLLYSKVKHEVGEIVTMDADLLDLIKSVPGVMEIFKK